MRLPFIIALASALLAGCATGPATTAQPVVLVHGAWMGAWSWDRVAAQLRSRGLEVAVVELPGHGSDATPPNQLTLQKYVDAVVASLPTDGRRAAVVGHSMAGMVISAAGEQAPQRIGQLVYVAAYLPRSGESLYQLSMLDTDSRVGQYWTQADPKSYSPATIRVEGIAEVFCGDCAPPDQQMLVQKHRAEAVPPLATPVQLTAARWGSLPRTYVHTLKDNAVSLALQRRMLAAAGGANRVVELDTSHSPMLTRPGQLADAIEQAARAR